MPKHPIRLYPVLCLLFLHFLIRAHQITLQVPHIDEGFHVSRALEAWKFDQNPGRFMHGKLLLYYWLGLFDPQPISALYVVRTSMAIFSLISAATTYQLGRKLSSEATGLLAVAIYAVFPFGVFFERLALADGFAAGFTTLVAWRSLIFVDRPTRREGVILGILITLTLMAKLTTAPALLFPILAILSFYRWQLRNWSKQFKVWWQTYMPLLVIVVGIIVIGWLPVLLPAGIAHLKGDGFRLLSENNLRQLDDIAPDKQLKSVLEALVYYTSRTFLTVYGAATVYLVLNKAIHRQVSFLLAWMLLLVLFSLTFANQPRPRYFVLVVAPLCLLLAIAWVQLWNCWRRRPVILWRVTLTLIGLFWLISFVVPFNYLLLTAPIKLKLTERERWLYLVGTQSGPAIEQAVQLLERADPPPEYIYSSWGTCQIFYFYTDLRVGCLRGASTPREALAHSVTYIIYNGDEKLPPDQLGLRWELLGTFPRSRVPFTVQVWRVSNPRATLPVPGTRTEFDSRNAQKYP